MPPYSDLEIESMRQQLLKWCERYPRDGCARLAKKIPWARGTLVTFKSGGYHGNVRLLADDLKKIFDKG